jgi:hypothetical protein
LVQDFENTCFFAQGQLGFPLLGSVEQNLDEAGLPDAVSEKRRDLANRPKAASILSDAPAFVAPSAGGQGVSHLGLQEVSFAIGEYSLKRMTQHFTLCPSQKTGRSVIPSRNPAESIKRDNSRLNGTLQNLAVMSRNYRRWHLPKRPLAIRQG